MENAIFRIRSRLGVLLRASLSSNWPKHIIRVVSNLNETPTPALHGLRPKDVELPTQSYKLREVGRFHQRATIPEMLQNEKDYLK